MSVYKVTEATVLPAQVGNLGYFAEITYDDKTYFGSKDGWFIVTGTIHFEEVRDQNLVRFLDTCLHRSICMSARAEQIKAIQSRSMSK